MKKLTLALDWTPNVNHIGFIIAKELGFYQQLGITLDLLNPSEDNYAVTPGKKLELGMADLAIAPFETVISLNNKANHVPAVAIYSILQNDLSCIATLTSSLITSPQLLDGKVYASYKARYEDHIVRELVKNDGGQGDLHITYPEKLGIWNTLLSGQADATWIFDNWEGIEASGKKIELTKFRLADYRIPYGYSPVVLTQKENITDNKELYWNFIQATKQGFLFTKDNVSESASILRRYVTTYDAENIDLEKAIAFTAPYFGDDSTCGIMKENRVMDFLKWITDRGLENNAILHHHLFTNELVE